MKFDAHSLIYLLPILAMLIVAYMNVKKAKGTSSAKIQTQPDLSNLRYVTEASKYVYGNPTLLECFATWCGPCKQQIPHLAELHKKFPQLNLISVSQESFDKVSYFVKSYPLMQQYNVAVDVDQQIGKYMNDQGVRGIPHCFLFDSKQTLVWNGHPMNVDVQIEALPK